jgi:hypothetical protein
MKDNIWAREVGTCCNPSNSGGKSRKMLPKPNKSKRTGYGTQMAEHLPNNHKALSSIPRKSPKKIICNGPGKLDNKNLGTKYKGSEKDRHDQTGSWRGGLIKPW